MRRLAFQLLEIANSSDRQTIDPRIAGLAPTRILAVYCSATAFDLRRIAGTLHFYSPPGFPNPVPTANACGWTTRTPGNRKLNRAPPPGAVSTHRSPP